MKSQKGLALVEVIVSLALLGIVGVLFLQGTMDSTSARAQADVRASAKVLAESVIDSVKKMDYSSTYAVDIPAAYPGFTADITAEYMSVALQKITVVVAHRGRAVLTLENYKADR